MKILYINNNRLLVGDIKRLLETAYVVDTVHSGHDGITRACSIKYNIILLDLALPDMSAEHICCELRRLGIEAPVIILSAQKDPLISVRLLDCGADDYITKPLNCHVLRARIAALLRRSRHTTDEIIISAGELTMNLTRRQVWRQGIEISLRRKEFDLLEYLVNNQGRALTRSMILDHVWELGKENWNNTVDVHIKHLRDKIDRPFNRPLIKTAYGVGYILDSPDTCT